VKKCEISFTVYCEVCVIRFTQSRHIMMDIVTIVLLLFVAAVNGVKETRSLGRTEIPVNFPALRIAERESTTAVFGHGRQLLQAIALGRRKFEVLENTTRSPELADLNDYEEISRTFIYDTRSDYTLLNEPASYVNLDDPKNIHTFGEILDLSSTHVTHCNGEASPPTGTFLLGTAQGAWMKGLSVSTRAALDATLSHLAAGHMQARRDSGLVLIRRVIRSEPTTLEGVKEGQSVGGCSKLHTEEVHPVELFSEFRIKAAAEHPFQQTYFSEPEGDNDPNFNPPDAPARRKAYNMQPDDPLPICTSSNLGGGFLLKGSGNHYGYALGIYLGCAAYEYEAPGSFNYNYDYRTGSAVTSDYSLGTGVTCHNCYAFFGAQVLGEVYYTTSTFAIEGKIGGGAGYSVNMNLHNPSISGSLTKELIPSGSMSSFWIGGTGLMFKYGFDGLYADISASVTASGTMAFGAANSLSATYGVLYTSDGGFSYPSTYKTNYQAPYMSGSLSVVSWSAQLTLTGYEKFAISFAGYVDLGFSAGVGATVGFSQAVYATASVNVAAASARRLDESLSTATDTNTNTDTNTDTNTPLLFGAGDTLCIRFDYALFLPNERTTLSYSIEKDGLARPILQRTFVTSASGNGTYETTLVVPWSALWAGNGTETVAISVQTSYTLSEVFKSGNFSTAVFTETDGIFTAPALGEVVAADEPYLLQWNPALLTYFRPVHMASLVGTRATCANVTVELVAERVHTNGSASTVFRNLVGSVINSGSHMVTFPVNMTTAGDRFYVQVRSVAKGDVVYGWSKGYFTFRGTTGTTDTRNTTSRRALGDTRAGPLPVVVSYGGGQVKATNSRPGGVAFKGDPLSALTAPATTAFSVPISAPHPPHTPHTPHVKPDIHTASKIDTIVSYGLKGYVGRIYVEVFFFGEYPVTTSMVSFEILSPQSTTWSQPVPVTTPVAAPVAAPTAGYCAVADCPDQAHIPHDCDYWYYTASPAYDCSVLETQYGCHCAGCRCKSANIAPTLAPTTAGCTGAASWIGDGYCDTVNNNAACGNYDGGDCCATTCLSTSTYTCGSNGYTCADPLNTPRPSKAPTATPVRYTPAPTPVPTPRPSSGCVVADGGGGCAGSGYNQDCDWWSQYYFCGELMTTYGCDCRGCSLCHMPTQNPTRKPATATCTGNPAWVGDGYCDPENNNAACDYDDGDCCINSCTTHTYKCGSGGYACVDTRYKTLVPTFAPLSYSQCSSSVGVRSLLMDGVQAPHVPPTSLRVLFSNATSTRQPDEPYARQLHKSHNATVIPYPPY
jgi:hypothetical protein